MCPPGVDQTMRSAQKWQVLAPELGQVHKLGVTEKYGEMSLIGALFSQQPTWDVFSLLARPILPPFASPPIANSIPRAPAKNSPLESLSNEILDMILDELPEKSDRLAFGLSSQAFWQLVLRRIRARYLKCAAPWAGTKLAFQGSYSMDLPAPFKEPGVVHIPNRFGNMCEARRFFWAIYGSDEPVEVRKEQAAWIESGNEYCTWGMESYWARIKEDIRCDLFPKKTEWILRNLDTHEIVSSKVLAERKLNLADALLMKICWTTIPSHGEEFFDMHQGEWAGHRFDIVARDIQDETGWQDVSEKVANEASELRMKVKPQKRFEKDFGCRAYDDEDFEEVALYDEDSD
jgi:hypothetical protein